MNYRSDRLLVISRWATMVFTLGLFPIAFPTDVYGEEKSSAEVIKEELQRLLKTHDRSDILNALAEEGGITIPGSFGFRGMIYSEYEFGRNCWKQGPQAGLPRNDDCITYESTCVLAGGLTTILQGSGITVSKPGGATISTTYRPGRRVYVCENTIHLPPEENLVLAP